MYLMRMLSAWTGRRSLEMVYDTDVDEGRSMEAILEWIAPGFPTTVVWVTRAGDVFGLHMPSPSKVGMKGWPPRLLGARPDGVFFFETVATTDAMVPARVVLDPCSRRTHQIHGSDVILDRTAPTFGTPVVPMLYIVTQNTVDHTYVRTVTLPLCVRPDTAPEQTGLKLDVALLLDVSPIDADRLRAMSAEPIARVLIVRGHH